MTKEEQQMVLELQEDYESHWNRADYSYCKDMIGVFCIINKHLTGQTGWRIRFEGSKADELINPRVEKEKDE